MLAWETSKSAAWEHLFRTIPNNSQQILYSLWTLDVQGHNHR